MERISSVTTHGQHHGARSFELLSLVKTEYVIVMDSDFFCTDEGFWRAAFEGLEKHAIVGIGQPWHFSINLPTTPFVAYGRQSVLSMVPEKAAWNHFAHVWPNLPNPVFDHLKFLFMTATIQNQALSIDQWHPVNDRKFSFFHFWDSRESFGKNFSDFADTRIDEAVRYKYLSFGISKALYHHVGGGALIPEFWNRVADVMKYPNKTLIENIIDVMKNLTPQLGGRPEWQRELEVISGRFFNEYGGVSLV